MNLSIAVRYPKPISVPLGATVEIEGWFDGPDHMVAFRIVDKERSQEYQLHPDEVPTAKPLAVSVPWKSPVVANVLGSLQQGEDTLLSVFPTNQTVYDYNRTLEMTHRAAVPAFWQLVEERQEWGRLLALNRFDLRRLQENSPKVYDASEAVQKLFAFFEKKRCFQVTLAVGYLWRSLEKLQQVERHLARLRVIDDLRRHLFTTPQKDTREFILRETEHEAGLVVESVATICYSALDLLGHCINEVYQLGVPIKVANFMNTVTEKKREGEERVAGRCLQADFPSEPLTKFLIAEREGWIRDLEAWRHYIIHHGVIHTGSFAGGGVLVLPPQTEMELLQNMRFDADATGTASRWAEKLRNILVEAYRLIGERAEREAALSDEDRPLGGYPQDLFQIDHSRPTEALLKFLRHWMQTDAEEPKRCEHMFKRLDRVWQREWPIHKFSTFIQAHPLQDYTFVDGISTSGDGRTEATVILNLGSEKVRWGFSIEPYRRGDKKGFSLKRTPQGTLPSTTTRLEISNLKRKQGGPEAGYRDAIFSGTIRNTTASALTNLSIHVLYKTVLGGSADIGTLEPGESKEFAVVWKDGCVPLGSQDSISVPSPFVTHGLTTRAVYRFPTSEGDFWAEEADVPPAF